MKKSLLEADGVDQIIKRAEQLQISNQNNWGEMNVTEMLLHCNLTNKFILEDQSDYKKPTLKQNTVKFIAIHLLPKLPRNNPGPARTHTKGTIKREEFDDQKHKFIETIKKIAIHPKPFTSIHPTMGYLNKKEWGIVAWMHMDHHLRQFGV